MNNFQGRYIIRHPWTGEIACENPRGQWGGPEGSSRRSLGQLGAVIVEDITELSIQAK
jgi:hypothetical protein